MDKKWKANALLVIDGHNRIIEARIPEEKEQMSDKALDNYLEMKWDEIPIGGMIPHIVIANFLFDDKKIVEELRENGCRNIGEVIGALHDKGRCDIGKVKSLWTYIIENKLERPQKPDINHQSAKLKKNSPKIR